MCGALAPCHALPPEVGLSPPDRDLRMLLSPLPIGALPSVDATCRMSSEPGARGQLGQLNNSEQSSPHRRHSQNMCTERVVCSVLGIGFAFNSLFVPHCVRGPNVP